MFVIILHILLPNLIQKSKNLIIICFCVKGTSKKL